MCAAICIVPLLIVALIAYLVIATNWQNARWNRRLRRNHREKDF